MACDGRPRTPLPYVRMEGVDRCVKAKQPHSTRLLASLRPMRHLHALCETTGFTSRFLVLVLPRRVR